MAPVVAEQNGLDRRPVPMWERAWLDHYPPGVPSSVAYPSMGVHALLENTADKYPDHPACTIFGQSIPYRDIVEQSRRLAHALVHLGADRGRRVGVLLPNIPEYMVALNAVWMSGATALQLSPLLVAEEIEKLLIATDCKIIITLDLLAPMVTGALEDGPLEHIVAASLAPRLNPFKGWLYQVERIRRHRSIRFKEGENIHHFDKLARSSNGKTTLPRISPDEDAAVMVPTGGTTGSPKIVMLSHRNLVANALQLTAWSNTDHATDSVLAVLPFFHAYGLTVCMLTGTATGATLHLHPRFEPAPILEIIAKQKPTLVPAVPAMLTALNRAIKDQPTDLSSIRAVICGASALDQHTRDEFAAAGAKFIAEGYGLSEAGPVTHANPIGEGIRMGTIGLPLPDTEARIMDSDTGIEEMPIGEVGELTVRGPQVMMGYYNNPEETARALRDGWLFTGDLAKRDEDGYFQIVDRKRDIIKTSGFLVYPAEVEEVLLRFTPVGEAAVVGRPDEERGEIVKALVVPRNGSLDVAALEKHCAAHLGKHKRPREIEVVKELPKNFLGKILRRRLREEAVGNDPL